MNTRKIQGMTLIELMVTLAIAGILLSFATVNFKSLHDKQQSSQLIQTLYHHLQFARESAITKGVTVTICPSDNGEDCSRTRDWTKKTILILSDINGNAKRDENDSILRTFQLSEYNGELRWRSFRNKSYLQWWPHGRTHYQSGNFTYCPASNNKKHARSLILNSVGRLYFGMDKNNDGIVETGSGDNVAC